MGCKSAKGHVWQKVNVRGNVWRCLRCGATQISSQMPRLEANPRQISEENKQKVRRLLPVYKDKLKDTWVFALEMRYGLNEESREYTYEEIAQVLGLSKLTVQKIIRGAIHSLEGLERKDRWRSSIKEDKYKNVMDA